MRHCDKTPPLARGIFVFFGLYGPIAAIVHRHPPLAKIQWPTMPNSAAVAFSLFNSLTDVVILARVYSFSSNP